MSFDDLIAILCHPHVSRAASSRLALCPAQALDSLGTRLRADRQIIGQAGPLCMRTFKLAIYKLKDDLNWQGAARRRAAAEWQSEWWSTAAWGTAAVSLSATII